MLQKQKSDFQQEIKVNESCADELKSNVKELENELKEVSVVHCSYLADFSQRISNLLDEIHIILGTMTNITLKKSTNLWKL